MLGKRDSKDLKLTPADTRALEILVTLKVLVRPGHFGELLWPDGYRGSTCSAPFARPAGKVLNRLRGAGFAEWVSETENWGWRATSAGRRFAERK